MVARRLLYWAAGGKGRLVATIANLDHRMLQVFVRFLREVCHVDEKRLALRVRVHKRCDLVIARRYWTRIVRLKTSQVFVYPHADSRSKLRKRWSKYGMAAVEFRNAKFTAWLDHAIDEDVEEPLNPPIVRDGSGTISRLALGAEDGRFNFLSSDKADRRYSAASCVSVN